MSKVPKKIVEEYARERALIAAEYCTGKLITGPIMVWGVKGEGMSCRSLRMAEYIKDQIEKEEKEK